MHQGLVHHHAVDDHSRLAYSEILGDERKVTASAFFKRAKAFYATHQITIKRVLTDNGSCYRSNLFKHTHGPDIKHNRTRPYRPQTNGRVERFNRTLNQEWPTPAPICQMRPALRLTRTGCMNTITTDPTQVSTANHPSTASPSTTSLGRTASPCLSTARRGTRTWR